MKKKEKSENREEKSELDALKKQAEDKEALAKGYLEHLQRLQAEFDNYRKRTDKEKEELVKFANTELVRKLLDTIDNLGWALNNKEADKENLIKGVEMTYLKMLSMLENDGLKKIEASGAEFNPELHEILLKEESNKESNENTNTAKEIVVEELQRGYTFHGKVIRPSMVKVGLNKEKKDGTI